MAHTVCDLVTSFSEAKKLNFDVTNISTAESGGVPRRIVYQHPPAKGEAVIRYRVLLPRLTRDEHLYFKTCIGLRDGFTTHGPKGLADGVRFKVNVNNVSPVDIYWKKEGWLPIALNLNEFAGSAVDFELRTHPANNSVCDWAHWGDPEIVKLSQGSPRPDLKWQSFPSPTFDFPFQEQSGYFLFSVPEGIWPYSVRQAAARSVDADVETAVTPMNGFFVSFSDYRPQRREGLILYDEWRWRAQCIGIVDSSGDTVQEAKPQ